MDFDLTDDQRLLSDSVAKLLAGTYSFEQRKALLKTPGGWSEALWNQFAELGLLGLPIAEEHGGFGGGPVDVMLLMQAFGRHLVLEPYLATVELGGTALVDLIQRETHTCYLGERGELHEWGHGCGHCPACQLRADGFARYAAARSS